METSFEESEAAASAIASTPELPLPFEILSFCVALPPSVFRGWDEPEIISTTNTNNNTSLQAAAAAASSLLNQQGIVGTIIILKKAVMIWFGWGKLITKNDDNTSKPSEESNSITVGSATNRCMGPLIVAMPRNRYQGAFSGTASGSMESLATSKLIGGSDECSCEDEETIGRQMSSRLSHRLGISVLISCHFQDINISNNILSQGIDMDMLQHRAAALAEREIYRLLQDRNLRE